MHSIIDRFKQYCRVFVLFLLAELLASFLISLHVGRQDLDLTHHCADGLHVRHALDELLFTLSCFMMV